MKGYRKIHRSERKIRGKMVKYRHFQNHKERRGRDTKNKWISGSEIKGYKQTRGCDERRGKKERKRGKKEPW